MSVFQNNLLMGAASQGAVSVYEIEQSIRFDDSGPAFMRRTPGSATNKRTWTYSGWIKRGDQPTNYAPGMLLLQHGNSGTGLQETIRINTASGSTHSTLMYYTEIDPFTGKDIFVEKDINKTTVQKNIAVAKRGNRIEGKSRKVNRNVQRSKTKGRR